MATKTEPINPRDGEQESPWQAGLTDIKTAGNTIGEQTFDVLIVGAGIMGWTTGLLLQQAGKKVIIADAHTPGFGTTGGTSAHINTFADTTYPEAESAFGEAGAQLFKEAIAEGYKLINDQAASQQIDCELESKLGYLYA